MTTAKIIPGVYGFDGEYRCFSNFWPCVVEYEGIIYPSTEHAYQAAKSLDQEIRRDIAELLSPGESKRAGRSIRLRADWEEVKVDVMYQLVRKKFFQSAHLAKKLYDTGDLYLEETNYWNDTFWGVCNGKGRNMLGILLMKVREEIREKIDASKVH